MKNCFSGLFFLDDFVLTFAVSSKNMGAYHLHKTGGGAIVHKIKTITFDQVGKRSTTKYIQMSWTDWKDLKTCIASNESPYFLKLPKRKGAKHLNSNRNFHFLLNNISTFRNFSKFHCYYLQVSIIFTCTFVLRSISYSYLPLFLTYRAHFAKV